MLLDDRCSVHSLHKLIFSDIKNIVYRQNILNHINKQGTLTDLWHQVTQKTLEKANQRIQRSKSFHKLHSVELIHRKILSDVDDTFFSSGGRFPAGCDASYPRHVLYPGVLSTYRELDVGRKGIKGIPGNLSFLSARPHVYRNVVEKSAFKRFKQLIAQGDLHCAPTMLAGSLGTGSSMFWGDYGPMGRQKFQNFNEFAKLWPESSFLFIGDNGQADVRSLSRCLRFISFLFSGVLSTLVNSFNFFNCCCCCCCC